MDAAVVSVASYRGSRTNVKHEIRSEIQVLDSDVSVAEDGQLTSAEIQLKGRLRLGCLAAVGGARAHTVFEISDSVPDGNLSAVKRGEVWLDRPLRPPKSPKFLEGTMSPEELAQEKQQPMRYQMLHVSTRQWNDGESTSVLLEVLAVEEIEGRDGKFVRVGAGYVDTDSWFQDHPLRQIGIF